MVTPKEGPDGDTKRGVRSRYMRGFGGLERVGAKGREFLGFLVVGK
jgi:hypothetical protein